MNKSWSAEKLYVMLLLSINLIQMIDAVNDHLEKYIVKFFYL